MKILEVGQFRLFKRVLPEQTTHLYTGEDADEGEAFHWNRAADYVRGLCVGRWDLMVYFPPVNPLYDARHGHLRALLGLRRRLARVRPLGNLLVRVPSPVPLVVLDFNDEPTVPGHAWSELERCVVWFKRELPLDVAKAFLDTRPQVRHHPAVMQSQFVQRHLHKLQPLSCGVPDETAALIEEMHATRSVPKTHDVFFAGGMHSTMRLGARQVLEQLRAEGLAIDLSEQRLPLPAYLERCARAWLTMSPEGYGWECMRHYEASLCGSVPVLSRPAIARYRPLPAEAAIYYSPDEGELREKIVSALSDKPALERMAAASRKHVQQHFLHSRIVAHILATID